MAPNSQDMETIIDSFMIIHETEVRLIKVILPRITIKIIRLKMKINIKDLLETKQVLKGD